MTNGTDILLLIDNDPIAALTSNDFNCEVDVKDITSKDSAGWRECKPMKKSFNGSANGFIKGVGINLIKSSENLANANNWINETNTITPNYSVNPFGKKTINNLVFSGGTLYINQFLATNTYIVGDVITFSIYAKGTGSIYIKIEDNTSQTSATITLTSTLTRYSVTRTILDADVNLIIQKNTATSVQVGCAMVNKGSTALPYERSGYTFDELYDLQNNGTKITMLISDQVDGNKQYSGFGYIKSLKHTDPVEDTSTFTCSIEGTADLSKTTI
jgi:hypothetical protein